MQNYWKYHNRVYVLKKHRVTFIKKFYSTSTYRYQKIVKIYKKFKRYFDFLKAKVVIPTVIKDCKVYTKTKALQYKSYEEFQTLSIFERTWSLVIIDFIVKLFKFKNFINNINYNNIFIIVEYFTKYSKFIPINEFHLAKDFVDIIIQKIINNYRLPNKFITDRNITFAFKFFIIFTTKLKVNSKLFIIFYPQTNK